MKFNAAMHGRLAARNSSNALRRRLLPALIAGCFASGAAFANPMGAQVVNGQASFSSQGNLLSITNSPGAIINWQSFSINAGETTRFIQQSADSAVLNRIVGQDPSQIMGALQSNGRVFLINPNGILFGQGAQVDVNGLVASTLNISNEDFINGRLNFTAGANAGNLQNQGAITTPEGGRVYLIAPNVENSGIITSPKGEVLLAAGHTVQLVDSANPDLHVVLSAPEHQAVNLGQVVAQGGKAGVYGALIHQRGLVSADSAVVGENGKIVFRSSRDTILDAGSRTSATGAGTGGQIHILGERVGIVGDAKIDASGQYGGGTILIGGDFQGRNVAIQNAQYTYVGKDADIRADALASGDGGKVIVWSDNATRLFGTVSARGGQEAGDGGFVEVSGKQDLEYRGKVDLSAANGDLGTLLLDPTNLTIVGGTGDGDGYLGSTGFNGVGGSSSIVGKIFYDNTGPSLVYQSEIEAQSSTAHIVLEATDNIIVSGTFANGRVTLASGSNLIMRTRNATTLDSSGAFGINLTGSTHGSSLEFQTQGAGTITIEAGTDATPWLVGLNLGRLTTAGGAITLKSAGAININDTINSGASGGVTTGGAIDITAGGGINFVASGQINGGPVSLTSKGTDAMLTMPAGSQINSFGSPITLKADNMSLAGTIDAGSSTVSLSPFTSGHAIKLGSLDDAITNMLALSVADLNSVRAGMLRIGDGSSGAIEITQTLGGGTSGALQYVTSGLSLRSAGAITQAAGAVIAGAPTASGPWAFQATGASVDLMGANPIGLIAGSASLGDFRYRSINPIGITTVDGVSGISLTGSPNPVRNIWMSSDSLDGIHQMYGSPVNTNGGGLILSTKGKAALMDWGNSISRVAADLYQDGSGTGFLELYSTSNMEVAALAPGFAGIRTNSHGVDLTLASGRTLTVNAAINAGNSEAALEADNLVLNNTVTASLVDIAPVTNGRAITVGSATCNASPCLSVTNLYRVAAHTIGIGREDSTTAGPIYVAGITNTGNGLITDRNSLTQRIGLLSAASVSQGGAIDVRDLGVVAHGTVNLSNSANAVSAFSAETWGGDLTFVNSKTFSVTDLLGNELDNGDYGLYGIWTGGGKVSLTAASGDINIDAVDPINPGIDAVSGDVTITSAGAITLTGNVKTTGVVTLNAGTAILGSGSVTGSTVTKIVNGVVQTSSTLNDCIVNPSLPGCSTLSPELTAVVTQGNAQLVAATNTVTSTTAAVTDLLPTATSGTGATGIAGTESSESTADGTTDETTTAAASTDNGAKNNEAAQKLYCN